MARKPAAYTNESITSLKGADRVRKRPGVIFGSDGVDGCAHSIFEILSNAIDEAREGYGNRILITKFKDGSVEVEDFGRGMPVDYNKTSSATTGSCCSARCTRAANTPPARTITNTPWA